MAYFQTFLRPVLDGAGVGVFAAFDKAMAAMVVNSVGGRRMFHVVVGKVVVNHLVTLLQIHNGGRLPSQQEGAGRGVTDPASLPCTPAP